MTSFRRVAFPLGFAAICGGALMFSLSTANGQPSSPAGPSPSGMSPSSPSGMSPSGMSGSPGSPGSAGAGTGAVVATTVTTTGSAPLVQTIGVSPVQVRKNAIIVIGGTGNETYDLQYENLYTLLRQRGVPIPNVLHPLSTAKPSFIIERLIVLNKSGGAATAAGSNGPSGGSSSSSPGSGSPSPSAGAGTTTTGGDSRLTDVAKTFSQLRAIVQAELTRGTGRLGGAHRQKLAFLLQAIQKLETQVNAVAELSNTTATAGAATNGADANGETPIAGGSGSGSPGAGGGAQAAAVPLTPAQKAEQAKVQARLATAQLNASAAMQLILEGEARNYARRADLYTPNIP